MSEHDTERDSDSLRPEDDLLEEQEGKGYGEDEGERKQSLDDQ